MKKYIHFVGIIVGVCGTIFGVYTRNWVFMFAMIVISCLNSELLAVDLEWKGYR